MNRRIKIALISVTLCLIMMFSCVSVFAVEDDFVIDTDTVYAVIPDDLYFSSYEGDYYYYFEDDDYSNCLSIMVLDNEVAPEGLKKADKNIIGNYFSEAYIWEYDEDYKQTIKIKYDKSELTSVNGLTAYYLQGAYGFSDYEDWEYDCPFYGYVFATKENIVIVCLETALYDGDIEYLNETVASLRINGTYLDGDKPTQSHTFSEETFEDALQADIDASEWYYPDDLSGLPESDEEFAEFFNIFTDIMVVVIVLSCIVPTIALIVLAIVFGVKYNKNSKKVKMYEDRFGYRGWGAYPNDMASPYQQSAPLPETFGIFSQGNNAPVSQDVNTQAPPVCTENPVENENIQ